MKLRGKDRVVRVGLRQREGTFDAGLTWSEEHDVLIGLGKEGNEVEELGSDGGEPEDASFRRDWKWVPDAIQEMLDEIKRLNETIEYLDHFKQNADFGPADGDVCCHIQREFIAEFRRLPPDGWDFDANGERMTEDDLVEILQGKVSDADKARG